MNRAYTARELAALCQSMSPTLSHARGTLLCATNDEPEELICPSCQGSGEGMHEGTRCRSCGGSGVERLQADDGPDWDAMRKDQIERDLMGDLS